MPVSNYCRWYNPLIKQSLPNLSNLSNLDRKQLEPLSRAGRESPTALHGRTTWTGRLARMLGQVGHAELFQALTGSNLPPPGWTRAGRIGSPRR
jgi:hypothetical protein